MGVRMICENCNINHNGNFGSGRFCCLYCSRSFSTKNKRNDINKKVSLKLTGKSLTESHKQKIKDSWKSGNFADRCKRKPQLIEELLVEYGFVSTGYIKKRLFKENIKQKICEECGILEEYNGKPIVHQLHHINGKSKDHRLSNLQILCPNCHSQTHNWAGKNALEAQLEEQLPTKEKDVGSNPI